MPNSGQIPLNRTQFGLRGVQRQLPGGGVGPAPKGGSVTRESDKSKTIILAVAGLAGVGIFGYMALGAQKTSNGPMVYSGPAACASAKLVPARTCESEWAAAQSLHARLAPAYSSLAGCEAVHGPGKCAHPATPGDPLRASTYIPAMAAYVLGKDSATNSYKAAPLHQVAADGSGKYRVSEGKPGQTDGAEGSEQRRAGGGGMFLFLLSSRAVAAAASQAPRMSAAPAGAPAGARPGAGGPAQAAAPATTRGGMGASAGGKSGGS